MFTRLCVILLRHRDLCLDELPGGLHFFDDQFRFYLYFCSAAGEIKVSHVLYVREAVRLLFVAAN